MPHLPFHEEQLKLMSDLACLRPETLDSFFRFLAFFDSPYFFFLIVPVIWLGFSYQWGLRVFYWFTLNHILNTYAKLIFGWPRPSTDLPEIGMMHPHTHGFPSGGAQIAMFLGGLLIYYWRTRAAYLIGGVYILLISFSRLYLGVHYPIDILGGWILAWILLSLFIYSKEPLEKWLHQKGLKFSLVLSLAIPLAIIVFVPNRWICYIMGSTMGVGVGTYFSLKYRLFLIDSKNLAEGISRSMIGVSILFVLILFLPGSQSIFSSFLSGLFMSLAASPICKWLMNLFRFEKL